MMAKRSSASPKTLDDWANETVTGKPKGEKRNTKSIATAQFDRARVEVEAMMKSGEWEGTSARHLVALYALMHERVYGVAAAELGPKERYTSCLRAGTLVKREFGGDYVEAVEFMRWAWTREKSREKWRRENGKDGGRIGPGLMFGGALLTDYRLAMARRR